MEITPRPRPPVTYGQTQRINTGCGKLYVTVNEDEQGLFEVFAQMGKSGGCAASNAQAIGRLISLAFRSGVSPEAVTRQLRGIRCPSPAWDDGETVLSCADAVAIVIERYLRQKEDNASEQAGLLKLPHAPEPPAPKIALSKSADEVNPHQLGACPECGGHLVFESGCATCPYCGWSKCS